MRKNIFRILLVPITVSLYLILSGNVAFAQCGLPGMPPCPKKTKPKKTTTKTTQPKTTIVKTKPVTKLKTQSKFVAHAPMIELVKIPTGSFMMGSNNGRDDEKPVHSVNINYPFYMGKYEITQAQWKVVMGNNPSYFSNCGDDCPVETVSWNDAKEFIRKLNDLQNDYEYRFPTEAEWEFTCRAGTTTNFAFGDSLSSTQANFDGSLSYYGAAKGRYLERTVEVGSYQPNAWGLYDMHGNVHEWCEDIYNKDGYVGLPTNGSANLNIGDSSQRVLRSGSWGGFFGIAYALRAAFRGSAPHSARGTNGDFGFRVVALPH